MGGLLIIARPFKLLLNQSRKRNVRKRDIFFLEKKCFKCIFNLRYSKGDQLLPILISSYCWDLIFFGKFGRAYSLLY